MCAIVMISAPQSAGLPGEDVDGQSPEELAGLLADALWFGCADASLRSYEAARPVGSSSTWVIGESARRTYGNDTFLRVGEFGSKFAEADGPRSWEKWPRGATT